MLTMGDLPDVNVWVALGVPDHPHHAAAAAYWRAASGRRLRFCRTTHLGMLRILSQPAAMRERALDTRSVWLAGQQVLAQPGVAMEAEPAGLDALLARWTDTLRWPARMWTNAYLAAFASAAHLRLVSFDADFARFPDLHWLHLTPTPSEAA